MVIWKLTAFKKDGRILLGALGTQNHFMRDMASLNAGRVAKVTGIWAAFWINPRIGKGEAPSSMALR